jgi:hypothetical protein
MIPKLTDEAVAQLPLEGARAALLEEIVGAAPASARRRWVAPLAAAVTVALLATGTAWWAATRDDAPAVVDRGAGHHLAVLDARGWAVTHTDRGADAGEIGYEHEAQSLDVHWYPADDYPSRLEDRRHITDPPSDGAALTVLGAPARMWAYSETDHTVVREVENGSYLEVRGSGMDEAAFRGLLARLDLVDEAGLDAALPPEFVTGDRAHSASDDILRGIGEHVDPLFPPGAASVEVAPTQTDPYQFRVEVVRVVVCSWLDDYAKAERLGDAARQADAAAALATARQWPVLDEMAGTGDWPDLVWQLADEMATGDPQDWYSPGLGCR